VYLERDVEKPAELLPAQGQPFDPPRRDGNAVGVVVVKADGNADARTIRIATASYFELGDSLAIFLRRARYRPAMLGGKAVAQCSIVPITVRTGL
jgi:phage-related tail fiber protein